jgi:hypothetical protein
MKTTSPTEEFDDTEGLEKKEGSEEIEGSEDSYYILDDYYFANSDMTPTCSRSVGKMTSRICKVR